MNEMTKIKIILSTEKCFHLTKQIPISNTVHFCSKCGILSYHNQTKASHFTRASNIHISDTDALSTIDMLKSFYIQHIKERGTMSLIPDWYITIRKKVIKFISYLSKQFNASNQTYYQTISYVDEVFVKKIKNLAKQPKKVYLLTIGCFILAHKFNEIDTGRCIIEDKKFEKISQYLNIDFSVKDLIKYELKCVKILKYNLNKLSIFDIVKCIKYSGFVFQYELKANKKLINEIYKKVDEILQQCILESEFFFSYNFFQITFSIIHYVRALFGLDNSIMDSIINKEIYRILEFDDYFYCYKKLQSFLMEEEEETEKNPKKTMTLPSNTPIETVCFSPVKTKRKLTDLPQSFRKTENVGKILKAFINKDVSNDYYHLNSNNDNNGVECNINKTSGKKQPTRRLFSNNLVKSLECNNFSPLSTRSKHLKNSKSINDNYLSNNYSLKSLSSIKSECNRNFNKIYLTKHSNRQLKINKLVLPKILC